MDFNENEDYKSGIPMDLVPDSWWDRCSGDGYKRYIDEDGIRRYKDNDMPVGEVYRPCAKCGKYPNENGDDFCLQHLGNVMNACCGHGKNEGYIQFDNDIMIRGYFDIFKKDKNGEYQKIN